MSDDEILNNASYYELLSLYLNRNTPLAARLSCGGTIDAALAVANGSCQRALAIVRPPGHHAEPQDFMGFCFYNNVAVATKVVQARVPTRVLILDWFVLPFAGHIYLTFTLACPQGCSSWFVKTSIVKRRFFFQAHRRQETVSTVRSTTTPPCFISPFTGMRMEPSILAASSAVLTHAEKAPDWDCM